MSNAKTVGIAALGLVGLYLLSGRGKDGDGGGFGGGGGGADRGPGDTVINFPELDLSNLWGGEGVKKDIPNIAPSWWAEHVQALEGRMTDLRAYESQGMTSEQAQHVDMLRRKFGQTPYDIPATKTPTPDAITTAQPFNLSTWMKTHNIYGGLITPDPVGTVGKRAIPKKSTGGVRLTRPDLKFYEYTKKGAHEGTLSRGRASPIKRLNVRL